MFTSVIHAQNELSNSGLVSIKKPGFSLIALQNGLSEGEKTSAEIPSSSRSSVIGGNIDPSFNASVTEGPGYVNETAVQPDGKIVAVGLFIKANNIRTGNIARFNSDGTIDSGFNNGQNCANNFINAVSLQADGKIIIGGNFLTYNGQPVNRLARLNTDGSLDVSFQHNLNFNNEIYDVVVQPGGKILVGGLFQGDNGSPTFGRIIRLNSDGTVDSSFNNNGGANGGVRKIVYQSNGKILIGGLFTTYAGIERRSIAQLSNDGSVDPTFTTGTGANGEVKQIIVQPNGKILIGGLFSSYAGMTSTSLARINSDGSFDTAFRLETSSNSYILVFGFALQSDGKIVVSYIDDFDTNSNNGKVIRFNSNAVIDTSFTTGYTKRFIVRSVEMQPYGKLLIGGDFLSYNNREHIRLVRTDADGMPDADFNPAVSTLGTVQTITKQLDGKILIGGSFGYVNGVRKALVARLNKDGSLD